MRLIPVRFRTVAWSLPPLTATNSRRDGFRSRGRFATVSIPSNENRPFEGGEFVRREANSSKGGWTVRVHSSKRSASLRGSGDVKIHRSRINRTTGTATAGSKKADQSGSRGNLPGHAARGKGGVYKCNHAMRRGEGPEYAEIRRCARTSQETLPQAQRHVRVDFPHRRDGKDRLPGELRLTHSLLFLAP